MTTFYDALSGEKRKLNIKTRNKVEPKKETSVEYFYGYGVYDPCSYSHLWSNPLDDHCACKHCGKTVIFVRALANIKKEKR